MDFSEALQIVQSAAGKQPREKELLTLTRHIPEFSGASGENVQDFLHGVDRVLTYLNVADNAERCQMLVSSLRGRALSYYRTNQASLG